MNINSYEGSNFIKQYKYNFEYKLSYAFENIQLIEYKKIITFDKNFLYSRLSEHGLIK